MSEIRDYNTKARTFKPRAGKLPPESPPKYVLITIRTVTYSPVYAQHDETKMATRNSFCRPLNLDVLLLVMHYVTENRDLTSAMRCCRLWYDAGIETLLHSVKLDSFRKISLFFRFMISKNPGSFKALHALDLSCYHGQDLDTSPNVDLFVKFLTSAQSLTKLSLRYAVLTVDPRIAKAIASYTTLLVLNLQPSEEGYETDESVSNSQFLDDEDEIDDSVWDMLNNLQSHLTEVVVNHPWDVDPVSTFAHSRTSLIHAVFGTMEMAGTEFSYPRLESLTLDQIDEQALQLSTMVPVFPNLRVLVVDTGSCLVLPDQDRLRYENAIFQEMGRAWISLDSVTADMAWLYVMDLQCHIDHLSITSDLRDYSQDIQRLKNVLKTTRPRRLTLSLELGCSAREIYERLSVSALKTWRGLTSTSIAPFSGGISL